MITTTTPVLITVIGILGIDAIYPYAGTCGHCGDFAVYGGWADFCEECT